MNDATKIVKWVIWRKERNRRVHAETRNMLPSTQNLFVYSDILNVEQIEGKMWINEWDGNNPPMILEFGISQPISL